MIAGHGAASRSASPTPGRTSWLAASLAVGVAYYLAARLGLLLQLPATNASPVWPPSGVGLAALMLLGPRVWPGLMGGAFLANLLTLPLTVAGFSASAAIAVGNTLELMLAWRLIQRLAPARNPFDSVRDVSGLIFVAIVACAVASTTGATSLWLAGIIPDAIYGSVWFTWWLGDTTGMLILAPALYCWGRRPRWGLGGRRLAEFVALLAVAVGLAEILFGGWIASEIVGSLPYVLVPSLMWAAFRFGPRETATAAVLLSLVAVTHTWQTMSHLAGAPVVFAPFVSRSVAPNDSLLMLQLFVCAIAMTGMLLAAAVKERIRASVELRAAHAALIETEQRYRDLYDHAPDYYASISAASTRILECNKTLLDALGYAREELVGRRVVELYDPACRDEAHRTFEQFLATGGVRDAELRMCRKDGSTIDTLLSISAVRDGAGRILRGRSGWRDITERKRMERAILDINESLEARVAERTAALQAALGEKTVLLQEIHHRVKNNLQVIISLLALQAGASENPETRSALDDSQGRIKSMAMLHQLLYEHKDFSRVDLGEYLHQLSRHALSGAGSARIAVEFDLASLRLDLERAVPCGLLVNELLSNACKHAFPGDRAGTLRLELHVPGDDGLARIVIADDGVGLPPEVKIGQTRSLGLQLVPLLAEQFGAMLSVDRSQGTRFELRFEVASE